MTELKINQMMYAQKKQMTAGHSLKHLLVKLVMSHSNIKYFAFLCGK